MNQAPEPKQTLAAKFESGESELEDGVIATEKKDARLMKHRQRTEANQGNGPSGWDGTGMSRSESLIRCF
jgi:hypothetical protein